MKAVILQKTEGKPGKVYYPLKIVDLSKPTPKASDVVVKMLAAALNHRDLFQRQHLYPRISFEHPILADGVGVVVDVGSPELRDKWMGKKVVLTPSHGWKDNVQGQEVNESMVIIGATTDLNIGCLQEYVAVSAEEIELAPPHLSVSEAAGLPLGGLTAYRAAITKAQIKPEHNVLITGIGGGVALFALQFAVAIGARVFVTSGSEDKIEKAKAMGASNGVIYKDKEWSKKLKTLLPKDRPYLDAVIDSSGGDIVAQTVRLLKYGGIISIYGMTQTPHNVTFDMSAVLKNIEIRGSTMGSRREFSEMVQFVKDRHITPKIDTVVEGMDQADRCFDIMKEGSQFGKLVITIAKEAESETSKL